MREEIDPEEVEFGMEASESAVPFARKKAAEPCKNDLRRFFLEREVSTVLIEVVDAFACWRVKRDG